jgi:hypothetical protein
MMSLQTTGGNEGPQYPQIFAAATYRANDHQQSDGEHSNFKGTEQPPKKFIPVYTFLKKFEKSGFSL